MTITERIGYTILALPLWLVSWIVLFWFYVFGIWDREFWNVARELQKPFEPWRW